MVALVKTPKPPYYAVIFTSIKVENDEGYAELSKRLQELATEQPGFLGMDSARVDIGITVSYWKDVESIKRWKHDTEHLAAQKLGCEQWYEHYSVRIAKVEHEYGT